MVTIRCSKCDVSQSAVPQRPAATERHKCRSQAAAGLSRIESGAEERVFSGCRALSDRNLMWMTTGHAKRQGNVPTRDYSLFLRALPVH
jgi:hypothetical protein